jgi:glycerate 2-kinase
MVRILVAPDKFKGSLTAREVCAAVAEALSSRQKFHISLLPLADGGEGTFEILVDHFKGRTITVAVHDPLMRKITASYGMSNDGSTAFIEMAKASGLQLLRAEERNPLNTSTYGTGELIADALLQGATNIILGIGGSATNDAGVGMASALGYTFFSNNMFFNPLGGQDLKKITRIDQSMIHPQLSNAEFTTLCDVNNPLTGPHGSAHVFARQKGATKDAIDLLEQNMISFADLLKREYSFDTGFVGAGAAGGLGAGGKFFLKAKIVSGMEYVSQATELRTHISNCDVVITGEGKLDDQSRSGKVVQHVAQLAREQNKKVIALCGINELDETTLTALGIHESLELAAGVDREYAITHAYQLVKARILESKLLRIL